MQSLVQNAKPSRDTHRLADKLRLTHVLIKREIAARYRGSFLGVFWAMITPLLMLGIYTLVFGKIFKARWIPTDAEAAPEEFAVILFVGLIVYNIFAETVNRSPTLIIENSSYVKKVVFPLEVLVPVALGTAVFHALVSAVILIPFVYFVFGSLPLTALLLPFTMFPIIISTAGIAWFLASVGTYARDVGQITSTLTLALMFLAPIFFPRAMLPEWTHPWLALNPVTIPVEQSRNVLIFGNLPDFLTLFVYVIISLIIAGLGFAWFQKTRKGFADVL